MKIIKDVWSKLTNKQLPWPEKLVVITLSLWILYFSVLWLIQYIFLDDGIYAGWLGSWADGSVHLTYAAKFAYGPWWTNQLPIYVDWPFTYAFAADLLTGLLVRFTGLSLLVAHQFWGWFFSVTIILLGYRFYVIFVQSSRAAVVGLTIFILSGGLGFIYFFEDIIHRGFGQVMTSLPRQYTHLPQNGIEWINPISGLLIPQRALLLGLIVGLILLRWLWVIYSDPLTQSSKEFVICGIALGFLPIVHPHTFIVLGCVSWWVSLLTWKQIKWTWIKFWMPAILISLGLIKFFVLPATTNTDFFAWNPGWLAADGFISWVIFWWLNWGLFGPLALVSFLLADRKKQKFLLPFVGLFVLANLWQFQPYDWDNTKILIWIHLVFSGLVAHQLIEWSIDTKSRICVIGAILVLTFAGGLDAIRLFDLRQNLIPMYAQEEVNIARIIRTQTNPDSLFLTSDRHSHPVPNLTGRQIVAGYRGWLWTYGIEAKPRFKDITAIYAGESNAMDLLAKYKVDYIVVGPHERKTYTVNQDFLQQNFTIWLETANYQIYQVL